MPFLCLNNCLHNYTGPCCLTNKHKKHSSENVHVKKQTMTFWKMENCCSRTLKKRQESLACWKQNIREWEPAQDFAKYCNSTLYCRFFSLISFPSCSIRGWSPAWSQDYTYSFSYYTTFFVHLEEASAVTTLFRNDLVIANGLNPDNHRVCGCLCKSSCKTSDDKISIH